MKATKPTASARPRKALAAPGRLVGETNASTTAAISKIGTMPTTICTERRALRRSSSERRKRPGKSSASAKRKPAPPAIQMAGSSREPWPTTNSASGSIIPARKQAAETAPSIRPLKTRSQALPTPSVNPSAQTRSETRMLLVAIWLPAPGAVRVSDSVQSLPESIASRIGALTKKPARSGFCAVRPKPRTAPPQNRPAASRIGRAEARTCAGQVLRQKSHQFLDRPRSAWYRRLCAWPASCSNSPTTG